jgi:hypothetical protein
MATYGTSCFGQLLSLVNRHQFERRVREKQAEKGAKGFTCWDQFVSMEFCQLAGAHSLREITLGLKTITGKVAHLGMDEAPARSTLAYANAHRPWQLFEAAFYDVLAECQTLARSKGRRFRFKNKLRSLDATVIDLCVKSFDWARFRRTKGGIKIHTQLDHQSTLPCWAYISEAAVHEVTIARQLTFAPGTIVAMDRGYNDYRIYADWTKADVYFVTMMKDNAVFTVVEDREVPERGLILRDQIIRLTGARAEENCPHDLRRIMVWNPVKQETLVILTNIMHLAASTIAGIYKERWKIELFFKDLKQNLRVKTFVGTSENAVHIQIWTALIAILLIKYLKLKSTYAWALSNLAALFRLIMFSYQDLWTWIHTPFAIPPVEPDVVQPSLFD